MTKPTLTQERDRLAKAYWAKFTDKQRWDVYGDFNAGFDAATAIFKERERVLREALLHYECSHYCNEGYPCAHDQTAAKALAACPEIE